MRFWETRRVPVGSVPPHPLKTAVVPTAAVWNHDSNCSRRYVLIRGRTSYARAEERLRESSITTLQRFPWPGKLSIVFTHGVRVGEAAGSGMLLKGWEIGFECGTSQRMLKFAYGDLSTALFW